MANLDTLVGAVWSARFLANLDKALVFGNAVNRVFQPDAEYGNAVNVDKISDLTIGDYTKNTNFAGGPQALTATQKVVTINQQKFFNFQIDSIDEAQARPNIMNKAMERAAYSMANAVDMYIAGLHAGATTKINTSAAPGTPTDTTVYGILTQAAKDLDKLNVPTANRFMIMGPAGIKLLKDSGEMLSDTPAGDIVRLIGQFGDPGTLPEGYKGRVAGFDLWMSNNTFTGGTGVTETWYFGNEMGISLVDSLNQIIGYQPELRFAEAVKGLYVYGAAVTEPDALGVCYTTLI